MKKKIILWHLLIIWCSIIFLFSHQNGTNSSHLSGQIAKIIVSVLDSLKNITLPVFKPILDMDYEIIAENLEFFIRKFAHFFVFMILGIITHLLSLCHIKNKYLCFIFSLMFCIFYATSDEFHQLFVSGRCAKVLDILIDASGSVSGILITLLASDYTVKKNKRK